MKLSSLRKQDLTEKDLAAAREWLAPRMIQSLIDTAIRTGEVDPGNKTPAELKVELLRYVIEIVKGKDFDVVIDHTNSLLERARESMKQEEYYFSCLFFATWIEHWVNGVISAVCFRKQIAQSEVVQIIREIGFRGKITWLFNILGLPGLSLRHTNSLQRMMDLRNGFVHYKWQGKNANDHDGWSQGDDIKEAVLKFSPTVKYLLRYEQKHLFGSSKSKARRAVLDKQFR